MGREKTLEQSTSASHAAVEAKSGTRMHCGNGELGYWGADVNMHTALYTIESPSSASRP
jgi:ribosomal protein L16/L10AE